MEDTTGDGGDVCVEDTAGDDRINNSLTFFLDYGSL